MCFNNSKWTESVNGSTESLCHYGECIICEENGQLLIYVLSRFTSLPTTTTGLCGSVNHNTSTGVLLWEWREMLLTLVDGKCCLIYVTLSCPHWPLWQAVLCHLSEVKSLSGWCKSVRGKVLLTVRSQTYRDFQTTQMQRRVLHTYPEMGSPLKP